MKNDAIFIIRLLFRYLLDYPVAVVQDFLWFKLNYRPNWLRARRRKAFARLDRDKTRLEHVKDRMRFYIKTKKDKE